MRTRTLRGAGLFLVLALVGATARADTVTYTYDALGRLQEVRYPSGSVVKYALDAAGNRTEVASGAPPGVPASITVPASSSTGAYTISWGTSTGTPAAYELYEATNSGFTGQVLAYTGTATSKAISGKSNGSYYYRVRACIGTICGGYRTGANATVVTLAVPLPPASITGPSMNTTGNFSISWASSTGATRYELWESINGGAFARVHNAAATSKSFTAVRTI